MDVLRGAAADELPERGEPATGSAGRRRLLRAALLPAGPEGMAADLAAGRAELPATSPWIATAFALDGVLGALVDDHEVADAALLRAAAAATRLGIADVRLLAGGMRSIPRSMSGRDATYPA